MDLADFPHLKELNLHGTVTGDIEDIGEGDFPAMEQLILPSGTVGLVNVWGRAQKNQSSLSLRGTKYCEGRWIMITVVVQRNI